MSLAQAPWPPFIRRERKLLLTPALQPLPCLPALACMSPKSTLVLPSDGSGVAALAPAAWVDTAAVRGGMRGIGFAQMAASCKAGPCHVGFRSTAGSSGAKQVRRAGRGAPRVSARCWPLTVHFLGVGPDARQPAGDHVACRAAGWQERSAGRAVWPNGASTRPPALGSAMQKHAAGAPRHMPAATAELQAALGRCVQKKCISAVACQHRN